MVAVDLHQRVGNLKSTFVLVNLATNVAAKGLEFSICCVSGKFTREPFHSDYAIRSGASTNGQYC